MASIHKLIEEAANEFEASAGKEPVNVYLGEAEMKALKTFAYESGYTCTVEADMRGSNRPEVGGLLVYAVNEITHIKCA